MKPGHATGDSRYSALEGSWGSPRCSRLTPTWACLGVLGPTRAQYPSGQPRRHLPGQSSRAVAHEDRATSPAADTCTARLLIAHIGSDVWTRSCPRGADRTGWARDGGRPAPCLASQRRDAHLPAPRRPRCTPRALHAYGMPTVCLPHRTVRARLLFGDTVPPVRSPRTRQVVAWYWNSRNARPSVKPAGILQRRRHGYTAAVLSKI